MAFTAQWLLWFFPVYIVIIIITVYHLSCHNGTKKAFSLIQILWSKIYLVFNHNYEIWNSQAVSLSNINQIQDSLASENVWDHVHLVHRTIGHCFCCLVTWDFMVVTLLPKYSLWEISVLTSSLFWTLVNVMLSFFASIYNVVFPKDGYIWLCRIMHFLFFFFSCEKWSEVFQEYFSG